MVYYLAIETKQKGNAFKLHGHNPSGSCTDGIIRIVHESSGAVDLAKYTVMNVDLKSKDLFGDVDDSTEDSEGAYVHWNIDKYHAAKHRKCDCGSGCWEVFESKCGNWIKREHVWDQLNGANYGTPVRFYKPM